MLTVKRFLCRRRAGVASHYMWIFIASMLALALFLPEVHRLQAGVNNFTSELHSLRVEDQQHEVRAAALDDFFRNVAMPPVCENPEGVKKASDCVDFAEPLALMQLWSQQDIDKELAGEGIGRNKGGSIASANRNLPVPGSSTSVPGSASSNLNEQPLCFTAHASAGIAATSADWALHCIQWVPPSVAPPESASPNTTVPNPRASGGSKDLTGLLVLRRYKQKTPFDSMSPEFDLTSGGENELVFQDIAWYRVFLEVGEAGSQTWQASSPSPNFVFCNKAGSERCAIPDQQLHKLRLRPPGGTLDHNERYGVRRMVIMLCSADTPDNHGSTSGGGDNSPNNVGDCVDALRAMPASPASPSEVYKQATIGGPQGLSSVWVYEFLF